MGADLVVFPEMSVSGYPTKDLAFRGSFIKAGRRALARIAESLAGSGLIAVVGALESVDTLYNGAAVLFDGKIMGFARKRYLFCCGGFDEARYFSAGERPLVVETDKFRAVVTIGNDFGYPVFPGGVELLINLWNEPYQYGRRLLKERMMIERAKEDAVAMVMAGPVGGQDCMIFEGASAIVNGFGEVAARGASFDEDLVMADLDLRALKTYRDRVFTTLGGGNSTGSNQHHLAKADRISIARDWPEQKHPPELEPRLPPLLKGMHELFTALTLAVRDFLDKNGLSKAVVGLSGGIDSAVAAAIACEAVGPERLILVSLPGPYTSAETRRDAGKIARNLGVKLLTIPIKTANRTLLKALAPAFEGLPADVTEENLQARIRGLILMALANKFRAGLLAGGNKSEAAVGYCTLYGDTNGAFTPLKDVYKTRVYELAAWINQRTRRQVIPKSVIQRAPTAELAPGQTDQDTLPPYADLDRILHGILEKGLSISELVEKGESEKMVVEVLDMLVKAEFKRRQSPIGPSVSERPLADLLLPITKNSGWWEEK